MQFWYPLIIRSVWIGFCSLALNIPSFAYPSAEGIQIYQKNMHLSWERKQNLAEDINRYNNADNLWDALRRDFSLPHYEDSPIVQDKIQWFLNHQDYLIHSMNRAAPYLYFIHQQVKKRHLPAELALLPIIESAYNPFAQNASSGAAGIWQMMPGTASGYGIRQNWWYDGRRDVVASTQAALNHLAYLQSFFEGNWLLAIAAYDTGEGNVLSAIRKNISNGQNTDFWSLPVALETQDYVPRLLALATIISHPDQYPIEFPPVHNAPYLAQVDIGAQIDLKEAAYLAGLSLKDLKRLNPGYSRSATDPNGPFKIILPIESVEQFTENLASSAFAERTSGTKYKSRPDDEITTLAKRGKSFKSLHHATFAENRQIESNEASLISTPSVTNAFAESSDNYTMQPGDTIYLVRRGDDIDTIAKHFHLPPQKLAMINQINRYQTLHLGQKIIVPTHRTEQDDVQKYQLTPGDTIYMVRRGDTIEKIASRFHTTPAAVRLTNLLASNTLEEGDQLVIPTHV